MSNWISDFDVIFLSYDEPNGDKNWADLLTKCPWAKRVHGVKGFDRAHKECAKLSTTERFITIDGDNIVNSEFFEQQINIPSEQTQISWSGKNALNGLTYGNGGPKLWTREFVMNMRTHEAAETEKSQTDFCWEDNYIHDSTVWSTTHITTTPFQAFKAGYREGVKMSLLNGERVKRDHFIQTIPSLNLRRLQIWASVGMHDKNGLWAIFGTRLGCKTASLTNEDISTISDYNWFNDFWTNEIKDLEKDVLVSKSNTLKKELRLYLNLNVVDLEPDASLFFMETNRE